MPTYHRGRVAPPNLEHLIHLSHLRNGARLQALQAIPPPSSWDSRTLGWVGPIKNQAQCGCHDDQTEVLTEAGWTKWEDYDWSTPLGTMNRVTGFLEFQEPTERHVYDYDGPLFYSDHRALDFALTPNHRLYARRPNQAEREVGDFEFMQIKDMGVRVNVPHATLGWAGTELVKLGVGSRTYDGDDFLALVALVISDGCVGSEENRRLVNFCCFREDRIEMVRALACRLGIAEQPSRPGVWNIRDGELAEWFRQNAFTGETYHSPYKHVPSLVKVASQRQITRFLEFFGDQHIQAYGGRRFYSSSRLMIDDLQELLLRIGKRGTIEESPPRTSRANSSGRQIVGRHPELMLTERKRDSLCLEKYQTRVEEYTGKVYCAAVPNHTLVTRRRGDILISSNSCWDFSGTCCVEVAYNKAGVGGGASTFILSEEYTLDCGRNGGCMGDDNTNVLAWAKATGLPLTSAYGPYTAGSGLFGRCAFKSGMTLYKIADWGFADSSGGSGVTSVDDIKAAIMAYGCVGCGIAADGAFESWGENSPSMSKPFQGSGSRSIDHDIVLLGWQDDSSSAGGSWILRNSWGAGWGVAGCMAIAYGANQVGTESVFAVVAAPAPPPPPPTPTPPPIPTPIPTSTAIVIGIASKSVYVPPGIPVARVTNLQVTYHPAKNTVDIPVKADGWSIAVAPPTGNVISIDPATATVTAPASVATLKETEPGVIYYPGLHKIHFPAGWTRQ